MSRDPAQLPIYPDAESGWREQTRNFGADLLLQAQLLALREGSNVVLSRHINEARALVYNRKARSRSREVLITFGGIFLGAFLPGFMGEVLTQTATQPMNPVALTVYTILGLAGIAMIVWGLRD